MAPVLMRSLRAALCRTASPTQRCRPSRTIYCSLSRHDRVAELPIRSGYCAFSSQSHANLAVAANAAEQLLARSLADREPVQALAHFGHLPSPPSQLLSQKLAMLLAKRGDRQQTERAVEILRSVYLRPSLQPDDYTKLASIYVVDACLRHRLLDQALEIHEEAFNVGVTLDLPAYDALVQALVAGQRLDDAAELLHEISAENDVSPTERSYYPLLEALIEGQDYQGATSVLEAARRRGVHFTSETFHPLVELADSDEDSNDSIVTFLSYAEQIWDEVKLLDEFADDEDDDGDSDDLEDREIPLVIAVDVDDDNDDDDDDDQFQ